MAVEEEDGLAEDVVEIVLGEEDAIEETGDVIADGGENNIKKLNWAITWNHA